MVSEFAGRVALITGAAGGIGGAVARGFAGAGAQVALVDRTPPHTLAETFGNGSAAFGVDLGDPTAAGEIVDGVADRFGRIDILVNVAGMMIYKSLDTHAADDWTRLLSVNLVAPALMTGAALRRMPAGGAIVNIASIHARRTSPLVASYAASKAALASLTRTTAIEGRAKGIRCNAILPGAIDTAMLRDSPNIRSGAETLNPDDIGRPEDVAELAVFLASARSAFVNGEEIVADGGRMGSL